MRLIVYRVVEPRWSAGLNRYRAGVIGAFVVLGTRCASLVWRKP